MNTEIDKSSGFFHPDHSEEVEYFEAGMVYCIQIESNLRCEQGCRYCYAASDYEVMKELPRDDIINILDSALRMEVRAIDWLGGDPLLRKDWYELMKYALEKNLNNNIWTSGIPLQDRGVAQKSVEVTENGFISVHLDTLDVDRYRKLHTGDPAKKIDSIIKGVGNVLELGKNPENMINCITFNNVVAGDDVKKTIEHFYKEFGIRTCLTQMCKAGLAKEHLDWVPDIQEVKSACKVRDNSNYPGSNLSICSMDTNKFYCGGIVCVTIDGDVTPCSVIREGFGNIRSAPLEEIVERHKNELLMMPLREVENLPEKCKPCENNSICWGCRAMAFYEKGDALAEDPYCWMHANNMSLKN
ncbi:MAG: radical SAM protein [Thermoplasmata archaeon]|nr:MAG: radical SAM protein [Thermoplasmata archaeon]